MKKIWGEMTLWDKVLIGTLIMGSIAGTIFMSFVNKDVNNKEVIIKVENRVVKRVTVHKDTDSKLYDFEFDGNRGYIEVKDGSVRMLEMDKSICPEGICSNTGWISKKYQTIVCLPNRIIVNIVQKQEDIVDIIGG